MHSFSVQTISIQEDLQYKVITGDAPWEPLREVLASINTRQAVFLVDENVFRLQDGFIAWLSSLVERPVLARIPAGESSKSTENWISLVNFCLEQGIDRQTPVVAVGGGVTGDLAGFVAASVLRGLPLIHIPTTILAMVDSSVGGKTGINHETGKNLIGAFYQPRAVVSFLSVLETLPDEEFISGFAEVLKYGAIQDTGILTLLDGRDILQLRKDIPLLKEIIDRCIKVKARVVTEDSKESGLRMILNYGHTFGHAIEKVAGYGRISHGQAVFAGMMAAAVMARKLGATINTDLIAQHTASFIKPGLLDGLDIEALNHAMRSDKKVSSATVRFILLHEYGKPYLHPVEDSGFISEVWTESFSEISASIS
ncbi:3-dehydroquinate synthase [Cyclonatronum proteinivorum]|uniref:3-dehydroquinate synthase n=1 Tax=Cyclonatronum proteinivorum TaxID=1457365 RepID=A0A345UKF7_9BACT|nr:3-dehydroquinate synthase [Cyclonatronum proteinivorum]AXJ00959.1 3-dehydroquinate synthase [Cyclonatronum proteinivorum]